MRELSVWAPRATRVELELPTGPRPLEPRPRGYWALPAPGLAAGALYRVRIDGGPPLPDPRSACQPRGVHGPSEWLDHSAFAWSDADFAPRPLSHAVIYELHVGTFSEPGTFSGAISHLDHLVQLGVTHVELMPVAEFPGARGWGYDGVALFAPHHAYGRPDDLKRLVDACHARGLAVLLDVVYNHLGPDGNYLGQFGPYFTNHYATPWGAAMNFDGAGSDEVRRFLCDNALHWLGDYHMDGLRLDAVHAFHDRSALPFLEQLSREVHALERDTGRTKVLIAESDLNDPKLIRSREAAGYGLDAQWSDDFHHALHTLLTGERDGYYSDFGALDDLVTALGHGFVYSGRYSQHRQRSHGRPLGAVPLNRLLGYVQNHDQVGNRAQGDRIGRTLSVPQLELAAALLLSGPFVPMIFQGEEWNATTPFCYFTDHTDAGLGEAVRVGRREEFAAFGWAPEDVPDPQAPETFSRSKLRWGELAAPEHARLLAWYGAWVRLRAVEPALTSSDRPVVQLEPASTPLLTIRRGRLLVCANCGAASVQHPVEAGAKLLLASPGAEVSGDVLHLPAWGVGVLRPQAGLPPPASTWAPAQTQGPSARRS
ncbi:MAG TPA: malto-oligosyltrehalose trehalohydrolase [Polyangiaceae bacterium]|nr:malto-oligosyltrehalose trehalohydrolase [Polyangiaceae bacterium]